MDTGGNKKMYIEGKHFTILIDDKWITIRPIWDTTCKNAIELRRDIRSKEDIIELLEDLTDITKKAIKMVEKSE
jgi:hypothetical protein